MAGGRPTQYRPAYCEQARKLCMIANVTDAQLAEYFEVSETTLNNWKRKYPKFLESIQEGKADPDRRVERSLYERATGYTHPEEKLFHHNGEVVRAETLKHYPPDTAAAFIWLKNRQPDRWRDRREVTGADGGPLTVEIVKFTDEEGAQQ